MIFVTGGTGLVGSRLLYELVKKNQPVRALIRNKSKIELVKKIFSYYTDDSEDLIQKIDWVECDMLEIVSLNEAFENVHKVYHCAAVVAIGGKNRSELIHANVLGTENIVNMCLSHNVEKLCHVSSIASLGESLNGELINENSKWTSSKNHSAYSVSKFNSEMEVWRGIQEGLNAVIVNPSVILGPGFWNSGSGSLFAKAAKGMKYFTTGSTGFVDVRDVADAMISLMESEIKSERFILNSENLNYKQLFDTVADAMQINKPKHEATKNLLKIAWLMDSLAGKLGIKKQEITKDVIKASESVSMYSNEKVKKAIGNEFIPIEECIRDIAKIFKKEVTMN